MSVVDNINDNNTNEPIVREKSETENLFQIFNGCKLSGAFCNSFFNLDFF